MKIIPSRVVENHLFYQKKITLGLHRQLLVSDPNICKLCPGQVRDVNTIKTCGFHLFDKLWKSHVSFLLASLTWLGQSSRIFGSLSLKLYQLPRISYSATQEQEQWDCITATLLEHSYSGRQLLWTQEQLLSLVWQPDLDLSPKPG